MRKNKKEYFGPDVDEAIIEYNITEDPVLRGRIFEEKIEYAINKLAENVIRSYKFYYMDSESYEDFKHSVVIFLLEKFPNYTRDKGKGFSFFTVVARNYCILKTRKNYKRLVNRMELADVEDRGNSALSYDFDEDQLEDQEMSVQRFISQFVAYWDEHLEYIYTRPQDQQIVAAIIQLLQHKDKIDLFNKKAIYLYIKEMYNVSTPQITRVVKNFKSKYKCMQEDYFKNGNIRKTHVY